MEDTNYLLRPIYSYAEADRLAKVTRGTSKRWIDGYRYTDAWGQQVRQPPVTPKLARPRLPGVSFVDLVEIVAIGGLKDHGFSLPTIRDIIAECVEIFGTPYPLASHSFEIGGSEIFVRHEGRLVGLLGRKRETAWREVLEPFLEQLDYRGEFAYRWWPLGKNTPVVIDPDYGFGLPVVAGTAIRTEIIAERFDHELGEEIAKDLDITEVQVERALQFEIGRRPAAA